MQSFVNIFPINNAIMCPLWVYSLFWYPQADENISKCFVGCVSIVVFLVVICIDVENLRIFLKSTGVSVASSQLNNHTLYVISLVGLVTRIIEETLMPPCLSSLSFIFQTDTIVNSDRKTTLNFALSNVHNSFLVTPSPPVQVAFLFWRRQSPFMPLVENSTEVLAFNYLKHLFLIVWTGCKMPLIK